MNKEQKTGQKKRGHKLQHAKAKILSSFYNNPTKDLKVILVTGEQGRATTAHFLHEILQIGDPKTGLIIDPISLSDLYRQLSSHWRIGANNVVISLTSSALANHLLYRIPVYISVNTDNAETMTPVIGADSAMISDAKAALLNTKPEFNVISYDHPDFNELSKAPVKTATFSYGHGRGADLRINRFKLYRGGTEANLSYASDTFDVATYELGEASVSYMAAAALGALALGIPNTDITDGIANYEEKH